MLYFVITIILLALFELGFTFCLNTPQKIPQKFLKYFKAYYMDYDRDIIQYNKNCAEYDSSLFYKLRSGVFQFDNREFNVEYRVNSQGFRDDESSLTSPEILVLGDSQAMGWGIPQDSTYANIIECQSRKKVLNTGISSYGTIREMRSILQLDLANVQYLIIQYSGNDFSENVEYLKNNNELEISGEERYLDLVNKQLKRKKYFLFKHLITLSQMVGQKLARIVENNNSFNPPKVTEESIAFLNVLDNHIQNFPKESEIFLFSIDGEKSNNFFVKEIEKQLLERNDTNLFKRLHLLDFTNLGKKEYFLLDDHINEKGHRIIAEKILNVF